MTKIWYILIDGKSEGPWTFDELKENSKITPDTLAWKEGFDNWTKIRDIPELKELFEEVSKPPEVEESTDSLEEKSLQDELVLEMGQQEPPYMLWFLIAFVSLMYVILQLYTQ